MTKPPEKKPLPPDYVRPSLEQYKATGLNPADYEKFFERHEDELRKHFEEGAASSKE